MIKRATKTITTQIFNLKQVVQFNGINYQITYYNQENDTYTLNRSDSIIESVNSDDIREIDTFGMSSSSLFDEIFNKLSILLQKENNFLLDDLPTEESVFEFLKMLDYYNADTEYEVTNNIVECNADPKVYNEFVKKYNLDWFTY